MGRGVPNGWQLLKDRHTGSAPPCEGRNGGGTHRSDVADAGAWGWTSAGTHQEYTALEISQRLLAGAGCVSQPVAF